MSEIVNAAVDGSKETGFSRRRVIKGVAWSVPVILTTVAVPPASASPGKFEALLDYASAEAATFVQVGREAVAGQNRPGKGPIAFHIKNLSGAPSGPITGTITITSADVTDPRVGISTFSGGTLTGKSLVTAPTFFANFSLMAGVANGSTVSLPLGFYYTGASKTLAVGKQFVLAIAFTSPLGLLPLATTLTLN